MRKHFNTEGFCNPQEHYMVNLDDRLMQIKNQYVDPGSYFVINRGRQFGKTTILKALAEYLKPDYITLFLDFQNITTKNFESETRFARAFAKLLVLGFSDVAIENQNELLRPIRDFVEDETNDSLDELFVRISTICTYAPKPMVLLIDEVDSASNNQVFVDFLALLRGYYLNRDHTAVFHSVILAGVYDIKNLKLKLRPGEDHRYNSPWNIAAVFDVDLSFSKDQIASMLQDYENDSNAGMDIKTVADEIYQYTSGYPFLVSAICKRLDERFARYGTDKTVKIWAKSGVAETVKRLLDEQIPLFGSIVRQLREYPDMKNMLQAILFQGRKVSYNIYNPTIDLAAMFGYVVNKNNSVQVSNRIFEILLYNLFLSEEELTSVISGEAQRNQNQFISQGRLNMDLVLEKFVQYYSDIYSHNDSRFLEEHGRKIFLLYLKPIINGTGNYYIEAQTRDARRTDVIVDYLGEQFIVEMKIWRGSEYDERGKEQLTEYLDYYHLKKGYMLSFNFNKNKEVGIREVRVKDRTIIEATV